jgi:hypothetical protein
MQQPTDQRPRVEVDQFLLPRGQLDLPLVLPAGPVLGEQARPVLGEGVDLPVPLVPLPGPADLVRDDLCHRKLALPDQLGIPLGAGDAELVDVARASCETAVAEVEAEEVGVGRLRQGQRITATDNTGTPTRLTVRPLEGVPTIEVGSLALSPLLDRASWNPGLASDLAVVATHGDKFEDQCNFLSCPHFRYPSSACPSGEIGILDGFKIHCP